MSEQSTPQSNGPVRDIWQTLLWITLGAGLVIIGLLLKSCVS